MNLHCSQTKSEFEFIFLSLISLRICTTLKLVDEASGVADRLIPLRICTTLKLILPLFGVLALFDSPTNLHYSQTAHHKQFDGTGLIPLRICTTLKLSYTCLSVCHSLIPLRICTTLKPVSFAQLDMLCLIPLRICTTLKPQMLEINDLRITCAISQVVFTPLY